MPGNLTYRLTAKGRAEAADGAGKLGASVKRLLDAASDGATFEQLSAGVPPAMGARLLDLVQKLVATGYFTAHYSDLTDSDLDITHCLARPIAELTPAQKRQAERHTIIGMRALEESGCFVKIVNRAGKRIAPHWGEQHVVLVIDGDEANAMVMARTLLLAGFRARSAATRDEIVDSLNRQPPVDVIAMDVVLPDVIGLELLGHLREHPVYKEVPVIVMASAVGHDDVLAALAYGAKGYLTKPLKPDVLLESVKAVLGLR